MRRLDSEGTSPAIAFRLPKKTAEQLDALIANLPPHPVAGPPPRSMVIRAVLEAGIEALALREGIQIGATLPPPVKAKVRKARASKKTTEAKAVRPRKAVG